MPDALRRAKDQDDAVTVWWRSLDVIWRDKSLGPAAKLAFAHLWWRAGGRPSQLSITTAMLGAKFGATHRAAARWLKTLVDQGIVEIIDRDERTGVIHVYVYDPNSTIRDRVVAADPQKEFDEFRKEPDEQKVDQDEPPSTIPVSDTLAPNCPDTLAPKCPDRTPESLDCSEKGEQAPDTLAPNCPGSPMEPKKERFISPKVHRTAWSNDHGAGDHDESIDGPVPIGQTLVEALNHRTHPQRLREAKAELVNWIITEVADPEMHHSIAGRAADAVIEHGLDHGELERIVEATRRKNAEGTLRESPGHYFHFRIRKICGEAGIPWPRPKGNKP